MITSHTNSPLLVTESLFLFSTVQKEQVIFYTFTEHSNLLFIMHRTILNIETVDLFLFLKLIIIMSIFYSKYQRVNNKYI